jgi:hypothetical protein
VLDLCRRCDVYIGYGGVGVARRPEGKSPEWLAEHCWVCHRSREEIREGRADDGLGAEGP